MGTLSVRGCLYNMNEYIISHLKKNKQYATFETQIPNSSTSQLGRCGCLVSLTDRAVTFPGVTL